MKKLLIVIVIVVLAIGVAFACKSFIKPNEEKANDNSVENNTEKEQANVGYDVLVSEKELTIEKGKKASFEITFTNPDESSVREYIHCQDQDDIVTVTYSVIKDKKITVQVEGLKEGTTEIIVSDYNYPDVKEVVKVNVK